MTGRRALRPGTKALHEIASIGHGGGLAACLVIDAVADRTSLAAFLAARRTFAAIAKYVIVPSMAVVVASGPIAMVATRCCQPCRGSEVEPGNDALTVERDLADRG